jgi:CxxC motif-containing protein (DUF1111 family)
MRVCRAIKTTALRMRVGSDPEAGFESASTAARAQTSSSTIRALDRKLVPLFSDLLLHDMGSLGDGIARGTAAPAEMKTAPLWGLRARTPLLHDGRAPTIDAAIRLHDGEAARVRDRYTRLNSAQQQQLLDFLKSI